MTLQSLLSVPDGERIRIPQTGVRVFAKRYYCVGQKSGNKVKLHPLFLIDGIFRIDPNKRSFFRDGSAIVEIDC